MEMFEKILEELHKYGIWTEDDLELALGPIDVTVFCGGRKNEQIEC